MNAPQRVFRFRLARLLRVREIAERSAWSAWADGERAARDGRERAQAAGERVATGQDELAELRLEAPADAGALATADLAVDRLREALRRGRARAQELEEAAGLRRRAWIERERERGALERLADRDRAEWRAERERRAVAELDEWAGQRHARNEREPVKSRPSPRSEPGSADSSAPDFLSD